MAGSKRTSQPIPFPCRTSIVPLQISTTVTNENKPANKLNRFPQGSEISSAKPQSNISTIDANIIIIAAIITATNKTPYRNFLTNFFISASLWILIMEIKWVINTTGSSTIHNAPIVEIYLAFFCKNVLSWNVFYCLALYCFVLLFQKIIWFSIIF